MTVNQREIKLPDTLGELFAVAIRDTRQAEEHGVVLDMALWLEHGDTVDNEQACFACMAGAVMLRSIEDDGFQVDYGEDFGPSQWPPETHRKLEAIDMLRLAKIETAMNQVYSDITEEMREKGNVVLDSLRDNGDLTWNGPTQHDAASEEWWATMEFTRDELLKAGI